MNLKNEVRFKRAVELHQQGRLQEAQVIYERILKTNPNHFDVLHLLGLVAARLENYQRAADLIAKAISINPNNATLYYNRGLALHNLKQFDVALVSYDHAIRIQPDNHDAYCNRGNVLRELKQLDASIASYDHAIRIEPNDAKLHYNRGLTLEGLKQLDGAVASYDHAIRIRPDYADAHNNRGLVLQQLKKLDEAVASYDRAIGIKPDLAEAYNNRGLVLQELKKLDEAVASYDRAIGIKPDLAEAYNNRGNALKELKKFDEALASYDRAIGIKPDYEWLLGNLLHTRMQLSDWSSVESNLAELIRGINSGAKYSPSFPLLTLTSSLSVQRKAAETWVDSEHPLNSALGAIPKSPRRHKIRIGYYSADFREHPVSILMAGLFELHNRSKFELIAFSFGPNTKDEMWQRVSKAFDQFVDVRLQSDRAVAQLSRELGIDIAVDLGGHTQHSRTEIFSYRAAPIQLGYLGYPGTTGANYIDYLVADRVVIPEASQQHYSEKIVCLPDSYMSNDRRRVISERVFTREELGLPVTGFVFCCFNNSYKITSSVFNAWVRILNATEGSVLWLREINQKATMNLYKEAMDRGLDPKRLVFAKAMEMPEHLARHRVADLFLDTLPFNAHTTASDALWAGLPVLTRLGESFASRVAASLLNAIRLPELITQTQEDYEALAIKLGNNPAKLQAIKDKLEANRLTTPLFDTALFTRNIEDAYTQMYERYQTDLPPTHIFC